MIKYLISFPDIKPAKIINKINFKQYLTHFKPEIIARGRDTLGTFVRERVILLKDQPSLNNMYLNGFEFC